MMINLFNINFNLKKEYQQFHCIILVLDKLKDFLINENKIYHISNTLDIITYCH